MSKKSKLRKEIDDVQREIEALEQKRERSQIAVMRAMISGQKAAAEDEQYFMVFSTLIDNEREHLRELYAELEGVETSERKNKKEKKDKKEKKKKKDK